LVQFTNERMAALEACDIEVAAAIRAGAADISMYL
jgi:hypothetical protein